MKKSGEVFLLFCPYDKNVHKACLILNTFNSVQLIFRPIAIVRYKCTVTRPENHDINWWLHHSFFAQYGCPKIHFLCKRWPHQKVKLLAPGKNHSVKNNRLTSSNYWNLRTKAAFKLTKISKNISKTDHFIQKYFKTRKSILKTDHSLQKLTSKAKLVIFWETFSILKWSQIKVRKVMWILRSQFLQLVEIRELGPVGDKKHSIPLKNIKQLHG